MATNQPVQYKYTSTKEYHDALLSCDCHGDRVPRADRSET